MRGFPTNTNIFDDRRPFALDMLNKIIAVLPTVCKTSCESFLFITTFSLTFYAFLKLGKFTLTEAVLKDIP